MRWNVVLGGLIWGGFVGLMSLLLSYVCGLRSFIEIVIMFILSAQGAHMTEHILEDFE